MSLLCRRHHLPVSWCRTPPPATLPCTLTMATPSAKRWKFWLALPYPNWLNTHKQTAPVPFLLSSSTPPRVLPTLEGSSCCDYGAISLAGNDNSFSGLKNAAAPPTFNPAPALSACSSCLLLVLLLLLLPTPAATAPATATAASLAAAPFSCS